MEKKVAVVMAHPDDSDIWSGGALINHRDRGDKILLVYCFARNARRLKEARKAAQMLKAKVSFLKGEPDTTKLTSIISDFAPNVIITHWENDTHHEHAKVFELVWRAIPTLAIDHRLIFNLYSCDSYNSLGRASLDGFAPTEYIDITSVWNQKMKLIGLHRSQRVEYWQEMAARQNRLHGARVGVGFAEGYIQIPLLGIIRRSRRVLD